MVVRSSVSVLTSVSHQRSGPDPPDATRVKQHPLTAMDAPKSDPSSTVDAEIRSLVPRPHWVCTGSVDTMVPSSSTIPVNMGSG